MIIKVDIPKNHKSKYDYTDLLLLCDALNDLITNSDTDEDASYDFTMRGKDIRVERVSSRRPNLRVLH